jgi:hypothetical protein
LIKQFIFNDKQSIPYAPHVFKSFIIKTGGWSFAAREGHWASTVRTDVLRRAKKNLHWISPAHAIARCVLEAGSAFPQLTPPICLYTQRPVWRLVSLRARALGYEALCAVVPPRYYRQQRAQSTTHNSGLLEL